MLWLIRRRLFISFSPSRTLSGCLFILSYHLHYLCLLIRIRHQHAYTSGQGRESLKILRYIARAIRCVQKYCTTSYTCDSCVLFPRISSLICVLYHEILPFLLPCSLLVLRPEIRNSIKVHVPENRNPNDSGRPLCYAKTSSRWTSRPARTQMLSTVTLIP